MAYTSIRYELRDAVAIVTLCRPDALNALTDEMKRELAEAIQAAERDESARAVVLTGDGRGFCAGEALNPELVKSPEPALDRTLRDYYHPVVERMRTMEKPIVAAINGTCAGAGVSLALAADLRIASEKASFVMAFVKIGLVPDGGASWMLPRLIGRARAAEMMMLGERVPAEKALAWGMIHKVVPDEALDADALALAGRLAAGPTVALGLMRQGLQSGFTCDYSAAMRTEAEHQRSARGTKDSMEGGMAFLQKREPVFRGE